MSSVCQHLVEDFWNHIQKDGLFAVCACFPDSIYLVWNQGNKRNKTILKRLLPSIIWATACFLGSFCWTDSSCLFSYTYSKFLSFDFWFYSFFLLISIYKYKWMSIWLCSNSFWDATETTNSGSRETHTARQQSIKTQPSLAHWSIEHRKTPFLRNPETS